MSPVRVCVRPYMHNFLTASPHSLLGGIDSKFQGLRSITDAFLSGKNEWLRQIFIDRESLASHRCESEAYQGSVCMVVWHTHCPTWRDSVDIDQSVIQLNPWNGINLQTMHYVSFC